MAVTSNDWRGAKNAWLVLTVPGHEVGHGMGPGMWQEYGLGISWGSMDELHIYFFLFVYIYSICLHLFTDFTISLWMKWINLNRMVGQSRCLSCRGMDRMGQGFSSCGEANNFYHPRHHFSISNGFKWCHYVSLDILMTDIYDWHHPKWTKI
jgi:hypothetical protein